MGSEPHDENGRWTREEGLESFADLTAESGEGDFPADSADEEERRCGGDGAGGESEKKSHWDFGKHDGFSQFREKFGGLNGNLAEELKDSY